MRLHYVYDDASRRIGLTLPDGQQQSWGYDPAGRVNGVIQPGGGSWTVAHNGAGQPTMASVPSGGSQVWGYDTAGRPTSATWLQAGSPVFAQVATLDPAGQRKGLADSWGTVTYGYDRAGRLASAGYPDGSTEADTYDPAGNRTTITATTPLSGTAVTTNSYDAADQLSTAATAGGPQPGSTTYGYDGNGNQTGSSGPSGTTSNTFNDLNQLTHITGPGTNLTLLYDGQGDRLRSYERGTPTWTLRNEAQDLAGGLSALVSDGTADYAYLSPGNGSAPLSSYTPATSRATYLATDLLGSVRLATDPAGATIGAGAYDAWGVARPYTGGSGATQLAGLQGVAPFGYAGQQRDAGPGTYAMRARRYDPTQGRFQSEDPARSQPMRPVTLDPYAYAGDSPAVFSDPSGLDPFPSVKKSADSVQFCSGTSQLLDGDHAAAVRIALEEEVLMNPIATGDTQPGCELNVPYAGGRDAFVKAVEGLSKERSGGNGSGMNPKFDLGLYNEIISLAQYGNYLSSFFDDPSNADITRKCGYVAVKDRSTATNSLNNTSADLVSNIAGHGGDLYELEPLLKVVAKKGTNQGMLEAWYYIDAARRFNSDWPVHEGHVQTLDNPKYMTPWNGPRFFELGSRFPPLLPVEKNGSLWVLGTIGVANLDTSTDPTEYITPSRGLIWFEKMKGKDKWEEELAKSLVTVVASKAAARLAVRLYDIVVRERNEGWPGFEGSNLPGGGSVILPPPDRPCGASGCSWAWFIDGNNASWIGTTLSRVTAVGGAVLATGAAAVNLAPAIGTVLKQLLDPSPSIAAPANELGISVLSRA